jgi:hypothetical protein
MRILMLAGLLLAPLGALAETDAEAVRRMEKELEALKKQNARLKAQLTELEAARNKALKERQDAEAQAYKREVQRLKATRERNVTRACRAWRKAFQVGRDFVTGKAPDAKPDDLLAPFRGKKDIWNVIYDRQYKDKRNKQACQQVALDKSRLRLMRYSASIEKDGISMYYGMAEEHTLPIMLAEKFIKPEAGDKKNLGGKITVIVRGERER